MSDNMTLLERYQPTTLADIQGHDTIRSILMGAIKNNNLPHLMLFGPPGCGKSTVAMALIRDLYGDEYRSNHIKTDASSDRGIDVIRGRIKESTRYKSLNFPFKIILMEEADSLTPDAQRALRETQLANENISRFIYIVNNLEKMITPIQDRCQLLRFNPLSMDDIAQHLKLIVKKEDIKITPAQISTIAGLSSGSMRLAVNCLQSVATQDHITDELIRTLLGAKFTDVHAKKILKDVYDGNQSAVETEVFKLVYKDGFTPEEIMHGLIDVLIAKNDPRLLKQLTTLAEYDFRMSQGAQPLIQLRVGLSRLSNMKK